MFFSIISVWKIWKNTCKPLRYNHIVDIVKYDYFLFSLEIINTFAKDTLRIVLHAKLDIDRCSMVQHLFSLKIILCVCWLSFLNLFSSIFSRIENSLLLIEEKQTNKTSVRCLTKYYLGWDPPMPKDLFFVYIFLFFLKKATYMSIIARRTLESECSLKVIEKGSEGWPTLLISALPSYF